MSIMRRRDRRRGSDVVLWVMNVCIVCCWFLIVASLLLLDFAKPQVETFFDRLFGVDLRLQWDLDLVWLNYNVLLFMFGLSSLGLLFNRFRIKRKYDSYSLTLLLVWGLSFAGLLFYVLFAPGKFAWGV